MKDNVWPKIYRTPKNGKLSFCVDFGRINGKRERRFFSQKVEGLTPAEQAKLWADQRKNEIKAYGDGSLALDSTRRVDVQQAFQLLNGCAVSLTEVTKFYLAHTKPTGGIKTIEEVIAELLQRKSGDGLRESTISSYKTAMGVFAKQFGKSVIGELSSGTVQQWLDGITNKTTRDFYFRNLSVLFGFAHQKGYCATHITKKISRPKTEETPIEILPVPQLQLILETARKNKHLRDTIPALVIGAFAGLRSSEIAKLEWNEIDLDSRTIEVKAVKSKTRQRRIVDIADNLTQWLTPFVRKEGFIKPAGYRERLDILKEKVKLETWPRNCLRHSFASYHLAYHKDAAKTAFQLGHHNTDMLFKHYRELVKPIVAGEYWAIVPPKR